MEKYISKYTLLANIKVSPDKKHVGYVDDFSYSDGCCVVIDGKEGKKYYGIGKEDPIFSPDGKRIAYSADDRDGNNFVIVDGEEGEKYDAIGRGTPIFSPDSKRVAYIAITVEDKGLAVIDGKEERKYDVVTGILFSPDSMRVAYCAKIGRKCIVVINGREEGEYDDLMKKTLVFSPDSSRLAYSAKIGDKWSAVVDGIEGKMYDDIKDNTQLEFSVDGSRLAYSARIGDKWFAVVDGTEGKMYDDVSPPKFSPDGSRLAYSVRIGDKWFTVVDGTEGKMYDDVSPPKFSPDGSRLAYSARIGDKWFAVVDGTEGKMYDDVSPPEFSPDSKRVAYAVKTKVKWSITIDGKRKKKYNNIMAFAFDTPDNFYYLAVKRKAIYLVSNKPLEEYSIAKEQSVSVSKEAAVTDHKPAIEAKTGHRKFRQCPRCHHFTLDDDTKLCDNCNYNLETGQRSEIVEDKIIKKSESQVSTLEIKKPFIEFKLTDPKHPARELIDEASRYADQILQVTASGNLSSTVDINTADIPPLVAAIDKALDKVPGDPDLLVAKSGALWCLRQFKASEELIDLALSISPDHFEALQRKAHWDKWPNLFQYPSWSASRRKLHRIMEETNLIIQLIRDGLQIGLAILVPARREDFPKELPNIAPKWKPVWSDTPYGPIVAHYVVLKDDPVNPWAQECFLGISHIEKVDPLDGYWLIQRLRYTISCFIILADGYDILYNNRYIFPDSLRSDLRIISDKYARESAKKQSQRAFNRAKEWHMRNFNKTRMAIEL